MTLIDQYAAVAKGASLNSVSTIYQRSNNHDI